MMFAWLFVITIGIVTAGVGVWYGNRHCSSSDSTAGSFLIGALIGAGCVVTGLVQLSKLSV